MDPFEHTTYVAMQMSNLCNYAWLHKKCPAHMVIASPFMVKEAKILPSSIVHKVLDTLNKYNYDGMITFHQYNEPLIDPRLFSFMRYAKEACPRSGFEIVTNGLYFNRVMAEELAEAGVKVLIVSLYGTEEEQEAKTKWVYALRDELQHLPMHIGCVKYPWGNFDDRLEFYSCAPRPQSKGRCLAPLGQVIVNVDADVALCCMDWKWRHTFGSLYEQPLDEILLSPKMGETYERLSRGDRFLDICQRCCTARVDGK